MPRGIPKNKNKVDEKVNSSEVKPNNNLTAKTKTKVKSKGKSKPVAKSKAIVKSSTNAKSKGKGNTKSKSNVSNPIISEIIEISKSLRETLKVLNKTQM
jgi:hypothetical protein